MPDDAVPNAIPADLPDRPVETLDDPDEDTRRASGSVADLVQTEPPEVGFDVPVERGGPTRPVADTELP
jgi:hypothetical protein